MPDKGLDRYLAERREREQRAARAESVARKAETKRYTKKFERIREESRAKRRAELERREALEELARARPAPPPHRTRREPPMVSCSRCSHLVAVSVEQKRSHRTHANPDGDPHYCRDCLKKLDFAA